jgi:hypothetical protein
VHPKDGESVFAWPVQKTLKWMDILLNDGMPSFFTDDFPFNNYDCLEIPQSRTDTPLV